MNKLRTNQGGSVASFIIIGVIIFSCLAGAIYFVNKRSEQAQKEQEIVSEEKNTPEKEKSENDSQANTEKVDTPTDIEDDDASSLPATGPELSVNELVGIFSLSTVSVAFLSSRKKLSRSL